MDGLFTRLAKTRMMLACSKATGEEIVTASHFLIAWQVHALICHTVDIYVASSHKSVYMIHILLCGNPFIDMTQI